MGYRPSDVSNVESVQDLAQWVYTEFLKLAEHLEAGDLEALYFAPLHAAPARPIEGMVVWADGTDWNPGATGSGLYKYDSGAWVKL